ncbi:MAG: GNAT family N-acetyltransferase [Paracoccaceae bacterium]
MSNDLSVMVASLVTEVSEGDWDACACPVGDGPGLRPPNPFVSHRFLAALEQSGSVGPGSGWQACHLVARVDGQIVGVMPLYAKSHSQGEYIFDHGWADAFERAGGRYYPKLQAAVPFTPVSGPRFLCRPDWQDRARPALLQASIALAERNGLSSLHITFCTQEERDFGVAAGLLARVTQQFHWQNQGFENFDQFLAALSSRKRKAIRKERATAAAFGGSIRALTGAAIEPAHWDAFWDFYQDTGARKWGHPYLTRPFFDLIHQTMRDDILLVLAERDGRPIAGALNFIGQDTLFGRYWGAVEDHPCLHFELCYYQAIDWAIDHGLARVEAGAQGEHKLARGYLPARIHSLHWLAHPGLRKAVAQYLEAERRAVDQDIGMLIDEGPFRKADPGTKAGE